jgi:hypothetical protein
MVITVHHAPVDMDSNWTLNAWLPSWDGAFKSAPGIGSD